jgi:hypothetical protein
MHHTYRLLLLVALAAPTATAAPFSCGSTLPSGPVIVPLGSHPIVFDGCTVSGDLTIGALTSATVVLRNSVVTGAVKFNGDLVGSFVNVTNTHIGGAGVATGLQFVGAIDATSRVDIAGGTITASTSSISSHAIYANIVRGNLTISHAAALTSSSSGGQSSALYAPEISGTLTITHGATLTSNGNGGNSHAVDAATVSGTLTVSRGASLTGTSSSNTHKAYGVLAWFAVGGRIAVSDGAAIAATHTGTGDATAVYCHNGMLPGGSLAVAAATVAASGGTGAAVHAVRVAHDGGATLTTRAAVSLTNVAARGQVELPAMHDCAISIVQLTVTAAATSGMTSAGVNFAGSVTLSTAVVIDVTMVAPLPATTVVLAAAWTDSSATLCALAPDTYAHAALPNTALHLCTRTSTASSTASTAATATPSRDPTPSAATTATPSPVPTPSLTAAQSASRSQPSTLSSPPTPSLSASTSVLTRTETAVAEATTSESPSHSPPLSKSASPRTPSSSPSTSARPSATPSEGTESVGATASPSATHVVPAPADDAVPVNVDAVAVDATVQGVVLVAGIVVPEAAMALLRVSVLAPRNVCSARWGADAPLDRMHSPTGLAVGASGGRRHVGAVVGNLGLAVGALVAVALVSAVVPGRYLVGDASAEQVAAMPFCRRAARRFATSRGTQVVLSAVLVLSQPTAASALTLLAAGASAGGVVAAVVALVVVLGAIGAATQLFRACYFKAAFVDTVYDDDDAVPCYGAAIHGVVRGQLLAPGDWCNQEDATFFCELWGPLFWDYRQRRRWYLCVELALSVALAAAEFLGEIFGCLTGAFAGLAVTLGGLVLLLWLRPHTRKLERNIAILTYALLLAVACCNVSYHLTGRGDGARDAAMASSPHWSSSRWRLRRTRWSPSRSRCGRARRSKRTPPPPSPTLRRCTWCR